MPALSQSIAAQIGASVSSVDAALILETLRAEAEALSNVHAELRLIRAHLELVTDARPDIETVQLGADIFEEVYAELRAVRAHLELATGDILTPDDAAQL